ncbi:RluA family pseudouridine synthase [Candidatus Peregrinibacteria bacterium]|jgi:RluA family pseudouridine synthase|nr:RluA family pseudouridine synthase [Candidatus Peregrinibacteria bacterium]MBT4055986.1 RluA family pseudouridine synthase [Candidatus Peregrinibacteria bacterium]
MTAKTAKTPKILKPLYEDEHILALNKVRGMLTVGNKPQQKNLLDKVKKEYAKQNIRLRPLNRLDRGTSGIVMFAKTREAFKQAVEEKKFSDTTKTYLALIKGIPTLRTNTITFTLPSRQDQRKLLPARTKYTITETYNFPGGKASLVEAVISSGRFHQIRRHFNKIHHPLLMDRDYMDRKDYKHFQKAVTFRNYYLHAYRIEFKHFVTGENVIIEAPIPKDLKTVLKALS